MTAVETQSATLPALDTDYPISAQQSAKYQTSGHIALHGVATPEEIAAYQPLIVAAAMKHSHETRPLEERDTYGKAFLQICNLWQLDEQVRQFVMAKRFAKIAADLMGVDGVRIYHDQALFKEPGGGLTPWHQDQHYWPLDTDKCITMWMPLVDVSAEVGTMSFASGSHARGYLGDMPISDTSEMEFRELLQDRNLEVTTYGALRAGDCTFHNGWTLHGAPGNPGPNVREIMTIIYFEDGLTIAESKNKHQEQDMKGWLPGLKPGDTAASELNPLLYKRS